MVMRKYIHRFFRLHPMIFLFVCGCIIAATLIAGIAQSVIIADCQYELTRLKDQFEEKQQIGQYLQLEVAKLQSLDRIEALARNELGMVDPTSVRTIVLASEPVEVNTSHANINHQDSEETPNRYLLTASRLLGRLLPALDQAEAGKLDDQ